jgi:protein-tyrosine phosphatase
MALEWAPGLHIKWIRENRLAVSPMPRRGEEEEIATKFNTVVSLASPSEHVLSGGYDPRTLRNFKNTIKVIWRPIGEYNAPTLIDAIKIVKELDEPALVHCFRGCGRSAVIAASWLIDVEGLSLPEALTEVSQRIGCGVETAPQLSVVEAYSLAKRANIVDKLKERDVDDPVPEYVLLLALNLSMIARRDPVKEAIESIQNKTPLTEAAVILSKNFDYSVARVSSRKDVVEISVWIPRRAHPVNARPFRGSTEKIRKEITKLISSHVGKRIEVLINVYRPEDVPWV